MHSRVRLVVEHLDKTGIEWLLAAVAFNRRWRFYCSAPRRRLPRAAWQRQRVSDCLPRAR